MIHCIGNSHVNGFRDYHGFASYHLWASTAYNFMENDYIGGAMKALDGKVKEGDWVALIVGEIDCRWHIPRQADIQGRTDEEVALECADRFLPCYPVVTKSYPAIMVGTHPTTSHGHHEKEEGTVGLVYGGMLRRNAICRIWNQAMKRGAADLGLPFVCIYDRLVDDLDQTKMEYYLDYCHLDGPKVYPFWVEAFRSAGISVEEPR